MQPVERSELAIEARGLTKRYAGGRGKQPVQALDGLTLAVPRGQVFGLLGPNGAGKSTTVKILSTLARPDSGTASVDGLDVRRDAGAVRRRIGLVSQKPGADPVATGWENLTLAGRIHGLTGRDCRRRADELLERFGLSEAAHRPARTYSGGMARRLDVALGLVARPRVLFLDEPTTGLDPEARVELWTELQELVVLDRLTVLLTTHYLDEADHLADRLAIVDHGRVVTEGTPEELKGQLRGDTLTLDLDDPALAARVVEWISGVEGLSGASAEGCTVRARADQGARAVPVVLAGLERAGIPVASASVSRPSLDDVYLAHAGRSLQGAA